MEEDARVNLSEPAWLVFAQMKALTEDVRTRKLIAVMAWAPFAYGFSPKAWQQTTNVMLEKKKNDINVKKLRAIALLDSISNHNNKALGRLIMDTAEKNVLAPKEKYGSWKLKECINQCKQSTNI